MKLFEKLRTTPEWEDEDGTVRARAVRDLPPDDLELLVRIAADDEDAAVRGAAVERIDDLETLVSIHGTEVDPAVRAAVGERVRDLLLDGEVESGVDAAMDLLAPRDLATVARDAHLPGIGRAALCRLEGEKHLAAVASRAGHVEIATAALERIVDTEALQTVAVKAEERSVALDALERLSNGHIEPELLEVVAKRSKQKAVARRAKALLAAHEEEHAAETAPDEEAAPRPGAASPIEQVRVAEFGEERAKRAQQAEERATLLAAARRLCEAVERVPGAEAERTLPGLREEWSALAWPAPDAGPPEGQAALLERFERAAAGCEQRGRQWAEDQAQLERLDVLVAEMERAELAEDGRPQAFWQQSDKDWRTIVAEFRSRSIVRRESRERLVGLERRKAEVDARRRAAEAAQRSDAERQAQENLERFERLCATVEDVAASAKSQLPAAERQLRAARRALEELRESDAAAPLPSRRARAALVRRLQQAHTALLGRVRELRDFADWKRWANLGVREELCSRLEALVDEKDDAAVATRYREIVLEWRRTADVPQDRDAPTRALRSGAREGASPLPGVSGSAGRRPGAEPRTPGRDHRGGRAAGVVDRLAEDRAAHRHAQGAVAGDRSGPPPAAEGNVEPLPDGLQYLLPAAQGGSGHAQAGVGPQPRAEGSADRPCRSACDGRQRHVAGRAGAAGAGGVEDDRSRSAQAVGRGLAAVSRGVRRRVRPHPCGRARGGGRQGGGARGDLRRARGAAAGWRRGRRTARATRGNRARPPAAVAAGAGGSAGRGTAAGGPLRQRHQTRRRRLARRIPRQRPRPRPSTAAAGGAVRAGRDAGPGRD